MRVGWLVLLAARTFVPGAPITPARRRALEEANSTNSSAPWPWSTWNRQHFLQMRFLLKKKGSGVLNPFQQDLAFALSAPAEADAGRAPADAAEWVPIREGRPPALPRPSRAQLELDEMLRFDVLRGIYPMKRDPWPRPGGFRDDYTHFEVNCTSCFEGEYRASLVRAPFAPALGVPVPLLDDAPIDAWRCIGRVLEAPVKTRLSGLACPGDCLFLDQAHWTSKHRFGMYGSVLRRGGDGADGEAGGGTFMLWLGERNTWLSESEDGLTWLPPVPLPMLTGARAQEHFDNVCVTRDLRPRSSADVTAAVAAGRPARRLLLGYSCGNKRVGESTCVGESMDGERGRIFAPAGARSWPADRRITALRQNETCEQLDACCGPLCRWCADANNCVRWDAGAAAYRLSKRGAYSISRKGRRHPALVRHHGWRAVRAVHTLENPLPELSAHGWASARAPWYLDRLGKAELLQRQPYALSVATAPRSWGSGEGGAGALQLGVLSVLHWPKLRSTERPRPKPPFNFDYVAPYLLPSRDGSSFGLEWVYAGRLLIPRGGCEPGALGASWCEADHGYIQPASELLDVVVDDDDGRALPGASAPDSNAPPSGSHAEHWLYYEGRDVHHERRFHRNATLLLARWRRHRIAGLAHDAETPACAARASCGQLRTRPFALPAGATGLELNVDAAARKASVYAKLERAGEQGTRASGPSAAARAQDSAARDGLDSVPLAGVNGTSVRVRWRRRGGSEPELSALAGARVRLEFTLCRGARLYAFALVGGSGRRHVERAGVAAAGGKKRAGVAVPVAGGKSKKKSRPRLASRPSRRHHSGAP